MTPDHPQRLLVTLDHTLPCEAAVRVFVTLMGGVATLELTGLYVEDEDLLRAASLPGLQEVSLSGQVSSLDPERLRRDLATAAGVARQAFEGLAHRLSPDGGLLRHRFEVSRGRPAEEFDRAATEHDAIIVSRSYRMSGIRPRIGRAYLRLARQPRSVLFINEPWDSGSAVVVLDGDASALARAARIAALEDVRLIVARPPGVVQPPLPPGAEARALPDLEEATLTNLCHATDARLLVLPPHADVDWAELLVSLLDRLECSLLKLGPA